MGRSQREFHYFHDLTNLYNYFTDLFFKVCIERKVFEEDGAEEASAEEESGNGRRSKFFAMDMSFTSCRDDFNFHECSSQINRYVISLPLTMIRL